MNHLLRMKSSIHLQKDSIICQTKFPGQYEEISGMWNCRKNDSLINMYFTLRSSDQTFSPQRLDMHI
jgi:hypothetical protein